MTAVVFRSKNEPLQLCEVVKPNLRPGEVLIKLFYASLNHLDIWIWEEQNSDKPVIPGSDGSGIVCAVANGEDEIWIGKEVIINPSLYWGNDEQRFSDTYQILGNPTNGTFAQYISIPVQYVEEKPSHLTLKEAAALPMAALTAYRVLFTKAKVNATDKVLITGIGGGAAIYLLQMAVAAGAVVYVTSSSDKKIQQAIEIGAKGGYNYKEPDWTEKVKGDCSFDVIIDSAGGDGFVALLNTANQAGRIVLFGRTAGSINNLNPSVIFNNQLQISGSVMGTSQEFKAMLQFYHRHQLHPVIDKVFPLEDIGLAAEYLKQGSQFGKILLEIS